MRGELPCDPLHQKAQSLCKFATVCPSRAREAPGCLSQSLLLGVRFPCALSARGPVEFRYTPAYGCGVAARSNWSISFCGWEIAAAQERSPANSPNVAPVAAFWQMLNVGDRTGIRSAATANPLLSFPIVAHMASVPQTSSMAQAAAKFAMLIGLYYRGAVCAWGCWRV